jgi:hypothetical protein
MRNFLLISFLCFIPVSAMSQKVTIQLKTENAALSEWQITDEQYRVVFSDNICSYDDSVAFTLEKNKRYFFQISVFEINSSDTILYSLWLNGEPVLLINSKLERGDHFYPFFTGTKTDGVKITGGSDASIADFPWQVYYVSGNYVCGGSIISGNWILTAAHCTEDDNGNAIASTQMTVKAGATNPYNSPEGKTYSVSEVIVHEGYNNQTLENDIALLKLSEPITIVNATPIKLINSDDVADGATDPGVISWVTGWGLTRVRPETFPSNLQKVQLPIVSNTQAATVWNSIPKSDIMAGYLNGNKDACSGDSGGPLVVPVSDEYKLAGIVSWGSTNCNTYGGYTRVSDFENWIRTKTGIPNDYKPSSPVGDTIICQGVESSQYSINRLSGATGYEWNLMPADAGTITGNSENGNILWNTDYSGYVTVKIRVTVNSKVSEWSKTVIRIVKNTKVISQSGDTVLCAEQPVNFGVNAEGDNLNYKWYHDESLILSGKSDEVIIPGTSPDDSGIYLCQISGTCGTLFSNSIDLTVHPLTKIKYLTPDSQVAFSDVLTLEVVSEGHNLKYRWQKDNSLIENGISSQLVLRDVNANDIGLYSTTVTGTCGTEISDTIYIYVKRGNSEEPEVFLWPTITNDNFHVALSTNEFYSIRMFSSLGQLVKEQNNCQYNTTININSFAKGVYIIRIYNTNFQRTLRLIKE